jgi:hypothetical protein
VSFDVLGDLNWLAVLVAGVVYFAIGAVWYQQPVFGKAWMRATGIEPDSEASPLFYLAPVVLYLVVTIALAAFVEATGTDTAGEGLALGLIAAVGIALPLTAVGAVFEGRNKREPWTWFAINGGYNVVGIVVASVILAIWD